MNECIDDVGYTIIDTDDLNHKEAYALCRKYVIRYNIIVNEYNEYTERATSPNIRRKMNNILIEKMDLTNKMRQICRQYGIRLSDVFSEFIKEEKNDRMSNEHMHKYSRLSLIEKLKDKLASILKPNKKLKKFFKRIDFGKLLMVGGYITACIAKLWAKRKIATA